MAKKNIRLVVARISHHDSMTDALNMAKSLVSLPRDINKNEDALKSGKQVSIKSNDYRYRRHYNLAI